MAHLRKTYRIFLTVFLLGDIVHSVLSAKNGNSWDREKLKLKQGEEGSATCTVTGLGPFDVVRLFKKNGGEVQTIADNDNIKSVFAASPRYKVTFTRDPPSSDTATVTLSYQGARGEDSGVIGCYKLGQVDVEAATLTVKVLVPVESVVIEQVQPGGKRLQTVQGSTVHMREGEERGVVCTTTVDGTTKPADTSIFVDGKDVTELFTKSEPEPAEGKDENSNGGIPRQSAKQEFTFVTSTPSHKWNEGNLSCVANAKGFPKTVYSVMVDVEYAPKITCPKYEFVGQLGESITMSCEVEANPGPQILWQYGDDHSRANDIEEFDEDGNMRSYQRALNGDSSEVSLTIELLDASHFTNYYLTADNDIDQAEVVIKLTQGSNMVSNGEDKTNPKYTNDNSQGKPYTVTVLPITEVKVEKASETAEVKPVEVKPTKVKISDVKPSETPEAPQESKQDIGATAAGVIPSAILLIGLLLISAWKNL